MSIDVGGFLGLGSEFRHRAHVRRLQWCGAVESDSEERTVQLRLVGLACGTDVVAVDEVVPGDDPGLVAEFLKEVRVPVRDAHCEVRGGFGEGCALGLGGLDDGATGILGRE